MFGVFHTFQLSFFFFFTTLYLLLVLFHPVYMMYDGAM